MAEPSRSEVLVSEVILQIWMVLLSRETSRGVSQNEAIKTLYVYILVYWAIFRSYIKLRKYRIFWGVFYEIANVPMDPEEYGIPSSRLLPTMVFQPTL